MYITEQKMKEYIELKCYDVFFHDECKDLETFKIAMVKAVADIYKMEKEIKKSQKLK
jgi:hypothetical protein